MFQLFKKRNFSDLVGDTFTFFKMYGKHYFKNYFIVNGGILLVLLVLVYFLMKIFFEGMLANTDQAQPNAMDLFMNDNLPLIIGLAAVTGLAAIFLSLVSYTYPVAYLKLIEEKTAFETSEILTVMKSKTGKIVIFFLASLFIMIPVMLFVMALSFALVFIIIGIPLLLLLIPALMCWVSLSFYEYIATDKGYFESLGNGFNMLRQKFWPCIGSTAVMYMIVQIVVGFVSMIPYVIGLISMFTSIDTQNPEAGFNNNQFSFFMIMMGVTMVLSILMNFIFQNFILVNQGIIYYSVREENENNTPKSQIDLIGTDGE